MINRPKPKFFRTFYKDEPPDKDRRKLISRFKRGGLSKFEDDVLPRMSGVNIVQNDYTDPYTLETIRWLYVGNFWWCRFRRWGVKNIAENKYEKVRINRYEFSRLLAGSYEKDGKVIEYDGLWDSRRHEFKPSPEVVFDKNGRKGVIVGYNEWEVIVGWIDNGVVGVGVPVRDPDSLSFMFVEDEVKYKKIFALVRKHVKKVL